MKTDIIGGFKYVSPNCAGCGKPLTQEDACLADGCPCNTALGINNDNETRWRLLIQSHQDKTYKLEEAEKRARSAEAYAAHAFRRIKTFVAMADAGTCHGEELARWVGAAKQWAMNPSAAVQAQATGHVLEAALIEYSRHNNPGVTCNCPLCKAVRKLTELNAGKD